MMPTTARTRLFLVRHGETVWHEENRYAGATSDVDLTEKGLEQAHRLAVWAQRRTFDAIVSSPVRRAVETVTPAAQHLGMDLRIVDDLREVGFGMAEGRTAAELRAVDPAMVQRFQADPAAHPYPGSENPAAAAHRAATALRQIAADYPDGRVLVMAHNTILRLALCELLELPVSRYRQVFPQIRNAAVSVIELSTDGSSPASLLSLNDRGPLTRSREVPGNTHQHAPTKEIP
jgi:probable phosphoglycerate mutase